MLYISVCSSSQLAAWNCQFFSDALKNKKWGEKAGITWADKVFVKSTKLGKSSGDF